MNQQSNLAAALQDFSFRSSNTVLTLLDADGVIVSVHGAIEQLSAFAAAQLVGRHGFEFVHEEDLESFAAALDTVVSSRDPVHVGPVRLRRADGEWTWCEITFADYLADKEIHGIAASVSDVTWQLWAQRRLTIELAVSKAIGATSLEAAVQPVLESFCTEAGWTRATFVRSGAPPLTFSRGSGWSTAVARHAAEVVVNGVAEGRLEFEATARYRTDDDARALLNSTAAQLGRACERIAAQEALERQNRRYRSLFEKNAAGVFVVAENKVADCNEALARMLGAAGCEAVIGRATVDFFADPRERLNLISEIRERGEVHLKELPLVSLDGTPLWTLCSITVISEPWEEPVYQGTVIDASEKHHAREALTRSERLHRELIENFPNGAAGVFDRDLRFLLLDGEGLQDVGISRAAAGEGKRVREVFPEIAEEVEPYYRAALAGVQSRFECTFRNREHLVHTLPLRDDAGRVYAGLVTCQEVTSQKLTEERLRKAEARLEAIVAAAADAIVTISEDGSIDSINPAAERLFAVTPDSICGRPATQLFEEPVNIAALLLSDGMFQELEGRKRDGTSFPLEASFCETDVDGERIWVGVLRDLTSRKQTERDLAALASLPISNPNPIVELDRDGKVVYANPAALLELGELDGSHPFIDGLKLSLLRHEPRFERSVTVGERIWQQDVFMVPGGERVRVFGRDVTASGREDEKLRRIDRLYSILAQANEIMVSARNEIELYERICELVVDGAEILAACVVVRDPLSGFLKSIASAGVEMRFAGAMLGPNEEESSPLHAAIRDSEPAVWVDDPEQPARGWAIEARRRLSRCAAAFPLHREGTVCGAIAFFASNRSYAEPGEQRLLAAIAADITFAVASLETERQRRLAEEALARERDFVTAVVDSADALVIVTDREGRVIRFNRACERLTGYDYHDIRLRLIWEFLFLPQDVARLRPMLASDARHETIWMSAGDERSLVSWSTAVLRDRAGEVEFVVITGIDVTETRRSVDALARSEEEFRSIVSNTSDLLFKIRADGSFTQLSHSTEAILGYRPEELVGRPAFFFVHSEESLRIIALIETLAKSPGSAAIGAFRFRHRNGSWRWLDASATCVPSMGQVSIVVTARDISERKRSEQREALQLAVSSILVDAPATEEIVAPLLEAFGSTLGWEVAEFWRVDRDLERLRFEQLWQAQGASFERLAEINHGLELPLTSMPGQAWITGRSLALREVADANGPIPRLPILKAEGIRSSLALPILGGDLLSGVIVLLNRDAQGVEPELLSFLEYVCGGIAQFAERQWTERELRDSRARLANAQRIAHMGDWWSDVSSGDTAWSDELYEIFGAEKGSPCSPEMMLQMIAPADRERVLRTRQNNAAWTVEYQSVNGRRLHEHGERHGTRMIGTIHDVTGQRMADAQLRKLSSAVEQSADMIMITDAAGSIEYVNSAFERITGYTKEQVLGRNPRLLQAGKLRPGFYARMWRLLESGQPFRGVFVNRKSNGEEFLEDKTITPLRDESGAVVSYVASGFDTTAERASRSQQIKLQEELRRAIVEWQLTFDAIDAPIVLVDPAGTIRRLNSRALELLGGDFTDHIGRAVESISGSPFWSTVADLVERVRTRHRPSSRQLHDGRVWDIAVTNFEARDGIEARMIVIARDVSGVVALQDSLRKSEALSAMGSLVAGVAHEVRNPLFGMSATLDAFEAELDEGEHLEYLSAFREQIGRLNSLMRELLEYGRSQRLTLVDGDLIAVVNEAIENSRPLARERGVVLRRCPRGSFPPVPMEPRRLSQAVQNLIENAIEHSRPGSSVAVAARLEGGPSLVVTVADLGPGIAEEDFPKLFEPFFTRRRGGTGLGLPIVKRIVEEHGGQVTLENRRKGGTLAKITIPLSGEPH